MEGHQSLYRAMGRIEGTLAEFREESRTRFRGIARQLDAGRGVMQDHEERLKAVEARPCPPAPSLRAEVAEILKAIAPAGGWAPWLLLAFLAVTGIVKPERLVDSALALLPAASSAPASP